MKRQSIAVASTVLAVGLLAGCVSNQDLMEVRQIAEQARADAAAAQQTASAAQQTANEARTTAEQAMQMSRDTDERVNRMFQRSMLK